MLDAHRFLHPLAASLLALGLCSAPVGAQASGDPNNPLTGSLGIQDPGTIVKCAGSYYVVGTHNASLVSKDRIHWTSGKAAVTSQSWWSAHGGDLWAADYTYLNGTYYCYYSVSASMDFNSAVGLTVNKTLDPTSPDYKWVDKGIIIDSAQARAGGWGMVNVIDPSTIVDSDGRWFLCFGSFQNGVRMIELNPATGLSLYNPPKLYEITGHAGEGSAAFHAGNYYYYAISQGKCCAGMSSTYAINYARATTITGPYMAQSGGTFVSSTVTSLLKGAGSSTKNGAVAVGVGGFFWDHIGNGSVDTLFMDYMAYTAPTGNPLLNIKPVYVNSSGWISMVPSQGTVITRPTKSDALEGTSTATSTSLRQEGDALHLNLPGWTRANLDVFDLTGRKIASSQLSVLDGHSEVNLRSLTGSGIREIRVSGDGGRMSQQVVLP